MENENYTNILQDEIPETSTNTIVVNENEVTLSTIHEDLGFICTFLVIAAVLVFIRLICKFFNIFF